MQNPELPASNPDVPAFWDHTEVISDHWAAILESSEGHLGVIWGTILGIIEILKKYAKKFGRKPCRPGNDHVRLGPGVPSEYSKHRFCYDFN